MCIVKTKKTRKNYPGNALREALEMVMSGQMTAHKAAKVYGVPKRTIYARLHKIKTENPVDILKPLNHPFY